MEFGFVSALSDTNLQIGSDGLIGVGVKVSVGAAGVFIRVGVFVGGFGVFVEGFVAVGVGVIVLVGVRVGNTTCVYVGGSVGEGVRVIVEVGTSVGVDVIALSICPCACTSEMGVTSPAEQYWPVIVQAIVSSSPVIGWGGEGGLID